MPQEARQLCDLGLLLIKAIADRVCSGKFNAAAIARFPGQVVLPRMCFRPNLGDQSERQAGECTGLGGTARGWAGLPC